MMKKIVLIILGVISLLAGLSLVAAGSGLLALGGRHGTIRTGYHQIATATPALVSDTATVKSGANSSVPSSVVTLTIEARNPGRPLFLGVARASDVTAYLTGVPYEEIRDFQFGPFELDTTTVPGVAPDVVAPPPDSESFWVEQASGDAPTLTWKVRDGDYRLVIMNADGTPGVEGEFRLGVRLPALFAVGLTTLIFGSLVTLLGLGLLIWGIRTRSAPPAPPAAQTAYPPSQPAGYPPGQAQPPGPPQSPPQAPPPGVPPGPQPPPGPPTE